MDIRIENPQIPDKIRAISSKSDAHRLLICASLAQGGTKLVCPDRNADILATVRVLRALGAQIEEDAQGFAIKPICVPDSKEEVLLDCGESGSTLRFLLPVTAALGIKARFTGQGRLLSRPMTPLIDCMRAHGVSIDVHEDAIALSGKMTPGCYSIAGDISSQYISGLAFALPLLDQESYIRLTTPLESAPYVDLTLQALRRFGAAIVKKDRDYLIMPGYGTSPDEIEAEGDWSNAAFWLVCGAIGKKPVTVSGLDPDSVQGDKMICTLLRAFGAKVENDADSVTVSPAALRGIRIDARDIPDLVPVLAVAAACAEGDTCIFGASRLRGKESDRIETVLAMLHSLGAEAEETPDGMVIHGSTPLRGGEIDGANDHRIVMSAAAAALACKGPVTIRGAQAVNKSYPGFFDVYFGNT